MAIEFNTFNNVIDGDPRSAKHFYHGIDPSTEERLWDVPVATEGDVEDAVNAAQRAFSSWSHVAFEDRCNLVREYAEAFVSHEKEMMSLLQRETGKPVSDEKKTATLRYTPLGVIGAICPWNDIKVTAPAVVLAAFKNSGQICVASKRIYVHQSIYKAFLAEMVSFTKGLKVGNPLVADVDIGPMQNSMQYAKVQSFFADCKDNGYRIPTEPDPRTLDESTDRKGYFITPTIIDNPPDRSKLVTEEQFGPIIPVQPWWEESEVIARTNDTNMGLGACIWSTDIKMAERIAVQLEVGSVYINSPLRPDWRVYFSGQKESGVGGERGLQGLLSYCNAQAVHIYK
ncbi:MAG: hypothetical protein LQ350_000987 [Teloschistes chrysophthalmus]|nr:MAG: hypothetical protein LQ350_000987 [Niorma chrysophthalma]